MQFTYRARDAAGVLTAGELAGAGAAEVAAALRREGLFPVEIAPHRSAAPARPAAARGPRGPRMKAAEVVHFATQLSVMAEAGVPLGQALRNLAEQSAVPATQAVLASVAGGVEAGESFSAALGRFPRAFDPTFVNLVKAGEASGRLPEMLERTAERLENDLETRRKLLGAMIYPAAMLTLCAGSVVFLLTNIFPKVLPLFEGRDIELPLPTKVLITLSDSLTGDWPYYLAGAGAAAVGVWFGRSSPACRAAKDAAILRLPVLGPLAKKVSLGRSLRTLSATVGAGVPMLDSLKLAAAVAGNGCFERGWRVAADRVAGGRAVSAALADDPLFPPAVLQMLASGEKTGKLGPVLEKVGNHYDKEVAAALAGAMRLIEPLMTVLMGGIIGTIALAMLLPIFKLSGGVG